jgi:pyruvate-formate lyase-activating enzyme
LLKYKWNGFSFVDAPGSAAVIYTKGCNLTCDFCYNIDLLDPKKFSDGLNDMQILENIANLEKVNEKTGKKYNVVDWLIISGGEPFVSDLYVLHNFIIKAKLKNLKTGIYTNGYFPNDLRNLMPYLDYVHIDFKDPESFEYVMIAIDDCYKAFNDKKLQYLILNTTILKSRHTLECLLKMKALLKDYNPQVILQKDLKNQNFIWTLTPFYNNNDKINTLGGLASNNESYNEDELKIIIEGLS